MEPSFVIVWDPAVVSPEDYARLIIAFGDLVRASGGLGLERLASRTFYMKEKPNEAS